MKRLPNIHPGQVLLEEFLAPLGISQNALARAAGVPSRRINERAGQAKDRLAKGRPPKQAPARRTGPTGNSTLTPVFCSGRLDRSIHCLTHTDRAFAPF